MRFTSLAAAGFAAAALPAVLVLAACTKNIDTTEAVKAGVMDYMNSLAPKIGLDMNNMTVDVPAVSFDHDHARATVSVTPKIKGSGGMTLTYNLDRKGDKWVVDGTARTAGSTHGSGDAPPQGQTAPDGTQLPAGHPSVNTPPPGTQLPPGHPSIPSTGNTK